MHILKKSLAATMLVAASVTGVSAAEPFYQGKQIRFIVAFDSGTDYDVWSRAISRHMEKHIQGAPKFVPQNMPGAGGVTATNHLYNIAEKDGTVIGMIGRNLPNLALTGSASVRFDPAKFNWIGSPELTNRVCASMDTSGVKAAEDLFTKELTVGGAGAGTAISMAPLLLNRLLDMKFKLVEGYKGSTDVVLAMERGEVQGMCQTIDTLDRARPGWIEAGRMHILFNTERDPLPKYKAPSIFQFAKTDEQRQVLALFSSSVELGRPIVAPPGVPADRIEILRKAFDATMTDPDFIKDMMASGLTVGPKSGQALEKIVQDLMKTPPEMTKKLDALTRQ